jgi:CARDB
MPIGVSDRRNAHIRCGVKAWAGLPTLKHAQLAIVIIIVSLPVFLSYGEPRTLQGQMTRYGSVNGSFRCSDLTASFSPISLQASQLASTGEGMPCGAGLNLSLSRSNLTLVQGSSGSIGVFVSVSSPRSSSIALSVLSVPAGVQVSFNPSSGRGSFSSLMTVNASAEAGLGLSEVTVSANGRDVQESAILFLLIIPEIRDLVITSASVPPNAVVGSLVEVNVTVANYGSVSETFDLRVYANETLAGEREAIALLPLALENITLSWNTTGFLVGSYDVVVRVQPVVQETNLGNESFHAGQILLEKGPNPTPTPPPAAGGSSLPVVANGREIVIIAAILESTGAVLLFVRARLRSSRRTPNIAGRNIQRP